MNKIKFIFNGKKIHTLKNILTSQNNLYLKNDKYLECN